MDTDSWIKRLLTADNQAIRYFTQRDLLGEVIGPVECLWDLPQAQKILARQQPDGAWKYPGKQTEPREDYRQIETYRQFAFLVEKFGFDRRHPQIQAAAEYFFRCQSNEGDFRGIYARQYAPTYSPAILELLIKTGYAQDPRVEHSFSWMLSMRQDDGGWAIPLCTLGMNWQKAIELSTPLQPDRSKPHSHMVTGMVLRAFAAHPTWRVSNEAKQAGLLLVERFFKPDKYTGRGDKHFWSEVSYPFWFTDIVSALDSLSQMNFSPAEPAIRAALDWLAARQQVDGAFDLKLLRNGGDGEPGLWVTLAICRIFKRFSINGGQHGTDWIAHFTDLPVHL